MKLSERILEMRLKNVPDGDDWFGCALSEIMDIIDDAAQLEEENEGLKEAGQGILKIAKTIMPNHDFQTNNSVTAMRALLIEIIGRG